MFHLTNIMKKLSMKNNIMIRRWLPLLGLLGLLVLFFSFRLDRYLSFSVLRENHALLVTWTQKHYELASLIYAICYIFVVVISLPGAVLLTLAGGFLFGIIWGSLLVVISATVGATLLFYAVRMALGDALAKRASGWTKRMRAGFQKNEFAYLLMLRLIPLFPFWVVNIVPGILDVSAKTFIVATFIGIIPGSVVYVMVGNGLSQVFALNQTPNLGIIFDVKILFPLLALAALCLIPVCYQLVTRKSKKR